ncbi:hypothetical protein NPIL_399021 [Nephila pilipes]|uniref:Uncharacterized protein n=1 Tax=Nephila pilipes TaxID=299642 RepID=A0A8X6UVC4_NEPPI|nr:hypothetical protein NPIL_399021 [Nephila pilipes]
MEPLFSEEYDSEEEVDVFPFYLTFQSTHLDCRTVESCNLLMRIEWFLPVSPADTNRLLKQQKIPDDGSNPWEGVTEIGGKERVGREKAF